MSEGVKIIRISETDSTNRWLADYKGEEGSLMTIAIADYQTAGKGQGSNSWESERGANLTFSVKTKNHDVPADRQFILLEAAALGILEALRTIVKSGLTIKWPNDIYWEDKKISGTLSQCSIHNGKVSDCIMGIGINVNQTEFRSGAPNPVSLCQILGEKVDRDHLLEIIFPQIAFYLSIVDNGEYDRIDRLYYNSLYRKEGFFSYRDSYGSFKAEISDVKPNGHIMLHRSDGVTREYAFKEMEYII